MELNDLFDNEDLESIERKVDFERTLEELKARDKRIVYLYAGGRTQAEVGEIMGITQQRVQQVLANICKRLQ